MNLNSNCKQPIVGFERFSPKLINGVFAIAHRLSTLKYSNRLLILKDGKVDEIGTHEELVAKDGTYASLCRKQTDLSKIRAW